MATTNLPAEGRAGVEAPADAPREVSQPLQADYIADSLAKARVNEKELAPLTYGRGPIDNEIAALEAKLAALKLGNNGVPDVVHEPKPVAAAAGYPQPSKYVDAEPKTQFPAASNTDSPTRGLPGTAPVPAARSKPPIQVIGGFGEAEAEYHPLDGRELMRLVDALASDLVKRCENDLRFTVAITYPRMTCKLLLIVEGEADDAGFEIQKVMVPHEKTPLEVAQQYADSVTFVVRAQRREFDDAGNSESPADAIRDELGIEKPRKRRIGSGAGSAVVDVRW